MNDLFGWLSMLDDYDERKLERYEKDGILVSTCRVTDSSWPFETGVVHPAYGDRVIVVENYDTEEEARKGHQKWLKIMTKGPLPSQLENVGGAGIAQLAREFNGPIVHERGKATI